MKKRILCALLLLSLTLSFFAGCGPTAPADPNTDPGNSTSSPTSPSLNGVALESFVIVYDLEAKNSAKRLQEEMQRSFGYQLPLLEESALTGGENVIFVGDFGPRFKTGEASLRLCKEVNPKSKVYARAVSDLGVSYIVFPGTAEEEKGPIDYNRLNTRVRELLNEVGGLGADAQFVELQDTVPPLPGGDAK